MNKSPYSNKSLEYEEEILELVDNRDEFTRSDLQAIVTALVQRIISETKKRR